MMDPQIKRTDVERIDPTALRKAIDRFCAWFACTDGTSYDPYDIWGTRYGRWARRLYYRKHWTGFFATAPLILMEIFYPSLRRMLVEKQRYATADAQLALAFLNLHDVGYGSVAGCADSSCLSKSEELANDLLKQSIDGYSGYCWGYPFDWQNTNGLIPKRTPHITATPYCYEAFTRLADATGEYRYLDVAQSIAAFVYEDLHDTSITPYSAASSYTPHDTTKVINANAYRAFVLFDACERFGTKTYAVKAWKNLRFILQNQRQDGSWLYAIDSPREAFIDHFHTCFVLKNLIKLNRVLQNSEVTGAIQNGYRYYRKNLFDIDGNPRSYAIAPRLEIVRLEAYNIAEAMNLGTLLSDQIPEAFNLALVLARRLVTDYQVSAGYWITRIYVGGITHRYPFLRWPQAQLFHAMTALLREVQRQATQNLEQVQNTFPTPSLQSCTSQRAVRPREEDCVSRTQ